MPATKPKLILLLLFLTACALASDVRAQALHGTLVVAVPARDGLVVCSDKRLSNLDAGTVEDTFVKIRKVDRRTLFVATNTIAFRDRSSGELAFDVFDITSRYVQQRPFAAGRSFWGGLKRHLLEQLQDYLAKRKYEEWPATDVVNNRLLFNLLFFSTDGKTARSHTLRLFYEKKRTPAIFIPDVVNGRGQISEAVGKGKSAA